MNTTSGELLIYQQGDGKVRIEAKLENETLWLTQQQMAQLFDTTIPNINIHIKNILAEGELRLDPTIKDFLIVRKEGLREVERKISHYNLDMIISVGYRVKSTIATQFRIWATSQLKELIIKGFVMDDERLKNPPVGNSQAPDYFDEMLARVRDIRTSERRMYLRVREIFTLAADYAPSLPETNRFFSSIQNKLHFAVTGLTAAELIAQRANAQLPNMGLHSWVRSEIRKTDVTVAKNYLHESEIAELNRIVTMWLDFAEDQASRRKQVFMQDWTQRLDDFLRFNERDVLQSAGTISKNQADQKAGEAYETFAEKRRVEKEAEGEQDYLKLLEQAALNHAKHKIKGKL